MHLFDDAHLPSLPAADALTRDLPRDQALGLRLIALARAAAAMHMAETAVPSPTSRTLEPQNLRSSQAAGLMKLLELPAEART